MDVVIYILWCNEERRQFIETQLEKFALSFRVVYFKASTPDDSADYLIRDDPVPPKLQCCFRSHIRALHHFVHNDVEKHLLVLEDDVCLLRDNFVARLFETIDTYEKNPGIDYVTIGYLPATLSGLPLHTKTNMLRQDGGLYFDFSRADFTIWGSQAQLFSREVAKRMCELLHHSSGETIMEHVRRYTGKTYQNKQKHLMVDALLPLLFSQAIVCPPLVVENNAPSTIHGGDSWVSRNESWLKAEAAGMFRLSDYYGW